MAYPSTETVKIRQEATQLLDALDVADAINNRYVSLGGESFFDTYLETNDVPNTDISTAEFVTAIAAVQALLTWLDTYRPALAKLRL